MKPIPQSIFAALILAGVLLSGCRANDSQSSDVAAEPRAQWSAVALGQVDVEGGLLKLAMPREGVVSEVLVHAGDHVKQGQLLASLDSESARFAVAAAQASLAQSSARITTLQIHTKDLELRGERLAAVAAAGAGGQQTADDARAAVHEARGDLSAAKAEAVALQEKLAEARHEFDQQSLHAPVAAEVVRRTIQPGTMVNSQTPAAFILLPDLPRIIRAELNSAFVASVHLGMAADVIEDGSGRTYAAHVVRLGKVFGASELEEDPQLRANARNIECVLTIDPTDADDLLIGQRVQVRFSAHGVAGV